MNPATNPTLCHTALNELKDVAIVTAEPGTTRDVIEVAVELGSLPVVFRDTAGIREGKMPVFHPGFCRVRVSPVGMYCVRVRWLVFRLHFGTRRCHWFPRLLA